MLPTIVKVNAVFKFRMCELLGVSTLTGKRVKGDNDSATKEHHSFCNHSSGFDNFSILTSNNNDFKVALIENILINSDHPLLKKNKHSLPLELDNGGTYFYHMITVDWTDCSPLIGIILSNNCILFIDFRLVARDFLKFDWFEMLNGYVNIFH